MSSLSRSAGLHSIYERSFHEQRRSLGAWAVGLFLLALLMAAMYPTIRGNPQLARLHETYPEALRSLFAIGDLTTGVGFLRAELFSFVLPLLLILLAVLWGSDLVAGEEDRGTIDILMANPVSRRRVVAEKWAALATGVGVAGVAFAAGLAVGILAVGIHIGVAGVAAATVATVLLGLLFGSVALAVGAATGRRGLARGVAAALAVGAYMISALAGIVGWLVPVRPISPWYHALGVDPLVAGFSWLHLGVVAVLILAAGVIALVAFDRRDLGV